MKYKHTCLVVTLFQEETVKRLIFFFCLTVSSVIQSYYRPLTRYFFRYEKMGADRFEFYWGIIDAYYVKEIFRKYGQEQLRLGKTRDDLAFCRPFLVACSDGLRLIGICWQFLDLITSTIEQIC